MTACLWVCASSSSGAGLRLKGRGGGGGEGGGGVRQALVKTRRQLGKQLGGGGEAAVTDPLQP